MGWLQLIRWRNLLIILLTQLLAWLCVILPLGPQVLNWFNFSCLALSTMFIAAAGYVINDYFDIKIDLINKPEKVVLGNTIPRKTAIGWHIILNVAAILLAGYVAFRAHHPEWLLLQVSCVILLWFYSTDLKRKFVTGNVAVALLTALTVIALIIYEPLILQQATLLTWMREIVKDIEDYNGDKAEGCMTMPLKKGIAYSVRFTKALSLTAVFALILVSVILFQHNYLLFCAYIMATVVIPLCVWTVFLGRGTSQQHYHKASGWLKVVMIFGVLSMIVYYFQL
jgi:4-hydroxybenzoate polyprenyltransferase